MDEVFDLKERNQWLRRNIKNLLQQLIRATYGDTINRYCFSYIELLCEWSYVDWLEILFDTAKLLHAFPFKESEETKCKFDVKTDKWNVAERQILVLLTCQRTAFTEPEMFILLWM